MYSLFIGRPGEEQPSCNNILFQGPVKHEKLITYLNSADIFVLPTLHEGCCNAIVEAIACELPVVSSDRSFNHDILNEDNAILVNPEDPKQVAKAIIRLRDNGDLYEHLAEGARNTAKTLTIDIRANKIISFIEQKIR